MATSHTTLGTDLQGAVRLSTQGTTALVDVVEAVYERIARVPKLGGDLDGRASGIAGLVFKSVRGVTRLVGGSAHALLGLLSTALDGSSNGTSNGSPNTGRRSDQREALVAALNGVLGDHLAATANPLATRMSLRHQGQALTLTKQSLSQALPHSTGRVLVLMHGLCMNDLQWLHEGTDHDHDHDHGAALARELGYTPVYLRYNSGLPIAHNGSAFAQQMAALTAAWPHPIERLVLLCHSMGGLLARSALHAAQQAGSPWAKQVSDLVFLGTPHHGAPLERAGHWVDLALANAPLVAPLARVGQIRSVGIQDLRHGLSTPLPANIHCYAVAGQLGQAKSAKHTASLQGHLLGDGLVPLASALGQHRLKARRLNFLPQHQWVGQELNHMQLLSDPGVYAQLRQWLA